MQDGLTVLVWLWSLVHYETDIDNNTYLLWQYFKLMNVFIIFMSRNTFLSRQFLLVLSNYPFFDIMITIIIVYYYNIIIISIISYRFDCILHNVLSTRSHMDLNLRFFSYAILFMISIILSSYFYFIFFWHSKKYYQF